MGEPIRVSLAKWTTLEFEFRANVAGWYEARWRRANQPPGTALWRVVSAAGIQAAGLATLYDGLTSYALADSTPAGTFILASVAGTSGLEGVGPVQPYYYARVWLEAGDMLQFGQQAGAGSGVSTLVTYLGDRAVPFASGVGILVD